MPVLASGVYLGRLERQRSVGELSLSRNGYAPAARLAEHAHETDYLCLGLSGRFLERSRGDEQLVLPGMAVFHPAGERHADTFGPTRSSCLSISLEGSWTGALEDSLRAAGRARYAPAPAVGTLVRRLAREFDERDEASSLVLEGLTLELLAHFLRADRLRTPNAPDWMPGVLERLRAATSPTLGELAAIAAVHRSTLVRSFRRVHACSPGEYRRRWRLENACRWLATSDFPLAEVAARTGFVDQSHLTRALQRSLGVTPAAYRRATRGG